MSNRVLALFKLSIVSVEKEIFCGKVNKLLITGNFGEFEVLCNHAPLLTTLAPGQLLYEDSHGVKHGIVVFGGMVEVQPLVTTILADSYVRKEDINEEDIIRVKNLLENDLSKGLRMYDYARTRVELAQAIAQLKFLRKYTLSKTL